MKAQTIAGICLTLLVLAAGGVRAEPTSALVQKYTSQLNDLKEELSKSVPAVDAEKQTAFLKAIDADRSAVKDLQAKQAAYKKLTDTSLLQHRQEWVRKATADVKEATRNLGQANAALKAHPNKEDAAALKTAQEQLAAQQANLDTGRFELRKYQDQAEQAKVDAPNFLQAMKAAEAARAEAADRLRDAFQAVMADVSPVLKSDKLDSRLTKFIILSEATPRGLAAFAQQGPEQELLVDQLLSDRALQLQMLMADGADDGQYGQAMQIYADIQKASLRSHEGLFQWLALATALEHATPVLQANPKDAKDAPAQVDPVRRYLHYEKAYLDGQLDPHFKDLTVWDYRMVVNGDESDEALAWGREMLRNYRPDIASKADFRWRYVEAVKTDVKYGSEEVKDDLPTLHPYQNMLMNGGVCGRRAFFGRFILRAFGVPTTARPQPGHAALVHWTPDGWVINLGAGWGSGTTRTRYQKDTDFLSVTQARTMANAFAEVLRAHWLGDVAGESRTYGLETSKRSPGFWNALAICRRQQLAEESKVRTLEAVGTDIGEANESKEKEVVAEVRMTDADRQITVGNDGVLTIPAAACSTPTRSNAKIRFMTSGLGSMQLHYSRLGAKQDFEYTFDAPAGGQYHLTARVVTNSVNQRMSVTANGDKEATIVSLPFTVGQWQSTDPVKIPLIKGQNVLRFSRPDDAKGLTIKDLTLTPVK